MPIAFNPATGRLEDENGNPVAAAPMDQMQAAGPPVGMAPGQLAANARAGQDLSQPLVLDRGGNDGPPMGLPLQTPVAPQQPPPVTPQQPPGMVRESGTISHTHEVASRAEREAMRQVTLGDKEGERIAGQQGDVDKEKAQQEMLASAQRANERMVQQAQLTSTVQEGQDAVAGAKQKYDAENERLSKMDVKDWWSTRSTGQKIAAAISVALGALGGALTGKGGTSGVMDILNKSMDDDYRLQRAQIDVQAKRVEGAKEGIGMARQAHADAMANLEIEHAAKWNQIGAAADAKAAQVGTQQAAVQAQAIKNNAEQRTKAHLQQWLEGMRDKVTSSGTSVQGTGAGGGKSTESQQKLAILAQQMNGDLDTIARNPQLSQNVLNRMQTKANIAEAADTTAGKGIVQSWLVGKGREANIIPKSKYEGFGDQEQLVANAWDNVTEKYVRVLTGAGMPESEARRMALQDQPHAGESPMVTGQKFQRMKAAANQYMSQAGPAAATIAPAAPGVTAPAGGVDQAKVQMARQRLQANPNDKVARDWLAAHGL